MTDSAQLPPAPSFTTGDWLEIQKAVIGKVRLTDSLKDMTSENYLKLIAEAQGPLSGAQADRLAALADKVEQAVNAAYEREKSMKQNG